MSVTSLLTSTPADAQVYPAASTTRTRFDPFGTPLTALPDTVPGTAEPGFGTVAGKLTDTITPYGIIDMGARLYSTVLGRFLQVDPVPGGGVNAYAYPPDPVNMNDYSGRVATADSYDRWDQHSAKPSRDGVLTKVNKARSNQRGLRITGQILGIAGGIAAILAISAIAAGPVGFAAWAAWTVASTALGLISTHIACSIKPGSFDCLTGMISVSAGGFGSIATAAGEVLIAGKLAWGAISALGDATGIASVGIGLGTLPAGFVTKRRGN